MQMNRTRVRRDRFDLRGWTYPFSPVRDGAAFARLETDTDETQIWTLRSGQDVEIRPGDIELIAPQIGMPVPAKRRARQQEVVPVILPEPEPEPVTIPQPGADRIVAPLEQLKARIDAVRADEAEPEVDELLDMVVDNPPGAARQLEDAVRAIRGQSRRRLSELLHVELAELRNSRGLVGEDLVREQQIEYLLGLFARLGEI